LDNSWPGSLTTFLLLASSCSFGQSGFCFWIPPKFSSRSVKPLGPPRFRIIVPLFCVGAPPRANPRVLLGLSSYFFSCILFLGAVAFSSSSFFSPGHPRECLCREAWFRDLALLFFTREPPFTGFGWAFTLYLIDVEGSLHHLPLFHPTGFLFFRPSSLPLSAPWALVCYRSSTHGFRQPFLICGPSYGGGLYWLLPERPHPPYTTSWQSFFAVLSPSYRPPFKPHTAFPQVCFLFFRCLSGIFRGPLIYPGPRFPPPALSTFIPTQPLPTGFFTTTTYRGGIPPCF